MRMSVCVRSVIRFIMLYLFIANPSITLAQFIGDFYIVIDPGHGGTDPGSPGYNGSAYPDEKELTFWTALNIDMLISNNNLGLVVSTRTDDITLDFDDRAEIADGNIADGYGRRVVFTDMLLAFIGVHYNASGSTSPRGTDIYSYTDQSVVIPEGDSTTSCEGLIFAGNLINTIQEFTEGPWYNRNNEYVFFDAQTHNADGTAGILGNNWGIFNAIMYGKEPWFAAVLVEFEFISNPVVWEIVEPLGIYYDNFYHVRAGKGVMQGWVDYFDLKDPYEFESSVPCAPFNLGRRIPLPDNLTLENISVGDTMVYFAKFTITAGPDFTVTNTGNVTFTAGNTITLSPGFTAVAGSEFRASIDLGLAAQVVSTGPVIAGNLGDELITGPDDDTGPALPTVYALHHAYPNPFNPTVTIRYDLPEPAEVRLVVYDLRGREVVRLVNAPMDAGYQAALWHGRDVTGRPVPSGLYIARLVTAKYTKSIKMILLK